LPEALIEGFAWDAAGRQYDDIAGVRAYSARVAGTVGAMMTLIMGVRDPHAIARALDLGIAMQLTNIARDIGEDARSGRLYLPRAWLKAEGVDPDTWLGAPAMIPGMGRAVARLLAEADALYMRASAGIAVLPRRCRWSIAAARKLYAEIGHEVARRGFDSVSSRAVVSKRHKLRLVASAIAVSSIRTGSAHAPSLPEAQFLVDAVTATPLPRPRPRGLTARAIRVIDLFARLKEHKS
jgi:phytoene synthase